MNAAIVSLAFGNLMYYRIAAVWGKSLQKVGTKADHFVIVPSEATIRELKPLIDANVAYRHAPVWMTPYRQGSRSHIVSKLNVLNYTEYERIFFCDADCYFTISPDRYLQHEQLFYPGWYSPLSDGRMVVSPNQEDYRAIKDTLSRGNFSLHSGWDECGEFSPRHNDDRKRSWMYWNFNGAEASQGLLFHRFGIVKGTFGFGLPTDNPCDCTLHTEFKSHGLRKWRANPNNAEYFTLCREFGFGDIAGDKMKEKLGTRRR